MCVYVQHDISLCNVVGLGSDYVYIPYTSRLYVLANPVGSFALVAMSLIIVYLMIVVGHNLQTVLGVTAAQQQQQQQSCQLQQQQLPQQQQHEKARWSVISMVALLLLACFCTGSNVLGAFVTVQDCIAFVTTTTYIAYYCIRVVADSRRVNPVNPMLASIAASVQRVYASAENPYSQTIAFMMLTWSLHKTSMLGRMCMDDDEDSTLPASSKKREKWYARVRWWRGIDILADCLLISVLLYAGVMGQASTHPHLLSSISFFGIWSHGSSRLSLFFGIWRLLLFTQKKLRADRR